MPIHCTSARRSAASAGSRWRPFRLDRDHASLPTEVSAPAQRSAAAALLLLALLVGQRPPQHCVGDDAARALQRSISSPLPSSARTSSRAVIETPGGSTGRREHPPYPETRGRKRQAPHEASEPASPPDTANANTALEHEQQRTQTLVTYLHQYEIVHRDIAGGEPRIVTVH